MPNKILVRLPPIQTPPEPIPTSPETLQASGEKPKFDDDADIALNFTDLDIDELVETDGPGSPLAFPEDLNDEDTSTASSDDGSEESIVFSDDEDDVSSSSSCQISALIRNAKDVRLTSEYEFLTPPSSPSPPPSPRPAHRPSPLLFHTPPTLYFSPAVPASDKPEITLTPFGLDPQERIYLRAYQHIQTLQLHSDQLFSAPGTHPPFSPTFYSRHALGTPYWCADFGFLYTPDPLPRYPTSMRGLGRKMPVNFWRKMDEETGRRYMNWRQTGLRSTVKLEELNQDNARTSLNPSVRALREVEFNNRVSGKRGGSINLHDPKLLAPPVKRMGRDFFKWGKVMERREGRSRAGCELPEFVVPDRRFSLVFMPGELGLGLPKYTSDTAQLQYSTHQGSGGGHWTSSSGSSDPESTNNKSPESQDPEHSKPELQTYREPVAEINDDEEEVEFFSALEERDEDEEVFERTVTPQRHVWPNPRRFRTEMGLWERMEDRKRYYRQMME